MLFNLHHWETLIRLNYNNTFFNNTDLQTNKTPVLCFDNYEQDRNGRKTMASMFLTTGLIVSNPIWEQLLKFWHNKTISIPNTHTPTSMHTYTPRLCHGDVRKRERKNNRKKDWETKRMRLNMAFMHHEAELAVTPCHAMRLMWQ